MKWRFGFRALVHILVAGMLLSAGGARVRGDETAKPSPPAVPTPVIEHVASELVLIETYVTDGKGRPVPGLGLDDFILDVDSHRQPIASLEYRKAGPVRVAGAGAPEAPAAGAAPEVSWPRRFVLFLEDGTSSPVGMTAARQAADRFLATGLTPSDQVAFAVYDKRLRILHDFTTDREAMRRAIAKSLDDPVRHSDFADEEAEHWRLFAESPNWASALGLCRAEVARLGGVVDALKTLVASLAPWNGYKAIIFMGDGVPEAPAAPMFDVLHKIGAPTAGSSQMTCTLYDELNGLNRAAASSGVTLHAIQTIGLAAGSNSKESRTFRRANSLQTLALNTGGLFSTSNDLTKALKEAEEDGREFYVLGYAPHEPADGVFHSVRVRCRKSGVHLRWRRGFTRLPPLEARVRAIEAAYLLPELYAEFDMNLSAVVGPRDGSSRVVDLVVHIPAGKLLFLPQGGITTTLLTVGFVAIDDSLKETLRTARKVRIQLPEGITATEPPGVDLYCRVRLPMASQSVTAVVADESAGAIGGRRLSLAAEPGGSRRIFGLSLYSLAEKSLWVEVPPASVNASEELLTSSHMIGPALKDVFAPGEEVVAGFKLTQDNAALPATVRLRIRRGEEIVRTRTVEVGKDAEESSVKVPLPVEGLASGEYTLSVSQVLADREIERESKSFRIEPSPSSSP